MPAAALLGFSSATPVAIALSIASRSEDIAEDAALLKLLRAIFSARARSADMSAYEPPFGFPAARAFAPASLAVATETPRSPALCLSPSCGFFGDGTLIATALALVRLKYPTGPDRSKSSSNTAVSLVLYSLFGPLPLTWPSVMMLYSFCLACRMSSSTSCVTKSSSLASLFTSDAKMGVSWLLLVSRSSRPLANAAAVICTRPSSEE